MRRGLAHLAAALLVACASGPNPPAAGRSGAWGYVQIVPREGVAAATSGSHAYGDRRYADVELVDYSRPGFAVVYAEDATPSRAAAELALEVRSTPLGARLEPAIAALGIGDALAVTNRSDEPHVVSIPAAGLVRRLAPGESASTRVTTAGEWSVFLLDAPGEPARLFAAPGRYAVVSGSGRFELADLAPGRQRLRAWHPRFPAAATWVALEPGRSTRVDFELRVDRPEEETAHAP
jgi:hypothetical protein